MRRILVALALALPVQAADSPTVEQAVAFYTALPWADVTTPNGPLVCLPKAREHHLDAVVAFLATRAKSICS